MNRISTILHQFDSRILFHGAMINIGGETYDCEVKKFPNGSYHVFVDGAEVCDYFWDYHIDPLDIGFPAITFQIQHASGSGADATLILPLLFARDSEDESLSSLL